MLSTAPVRAVIDTTSILRLCGDDDSVSTRLVKQVLHLLVEDASRGLFEASEALSSRDREALKQAADRVRADALAMGTSHLCEIAALLERDAARLTPDALAGLVSSLHREFQAVLRDLRVLHPEIVR